MRIAAVQYPSILDDAQEAIDIVVRRLQWAAEARIDLLVFPEAFLLGHSYDQATIYARAQEVSASILIELCERVAGFQATLVVGAFEFIGGKVFNSAFVIESGQIEGRYCKAYPNEPGVSPGKDFPIFVRSGMRYGINICNDANHADAAGRIAAKDAELILYPLNNMLPPEAAERWREKSVANLIARARQTGCWIASADVASRSDKYMSFGCTAIVAPNGHVVARVPELSEGIAVYDVPARHLHAMIPC